MEITDTDIRRAAMDLLARREHSFRELEGKLKLRFPESDLTPALERLREEGLQSDERFLESFIRSRTAKGYGPVRIRSELFRKGLESQLIAECLLDDDDLWLEMVEEQRRRKFGDEQPLNTKDKSKQYRFLAQRGFTGSQISSCFKR
ncbi:regulatory protein RecX [Endozoicomonas arenosclerae]|uniref:regulatory protein RecX n=1 Tax=Endozoicomonas arenosclerae TaxID=1633495 RepID=UPI000A81CE41|nr:regulatory protein RecX [Endozoicomonas arenosclerae]